MAFENLKSTPITNLDALPPTNGGNSAGLGAPGFLKAAFATVTATTGATTPCTYQLVRLPSQAKLTRLDIWLDASVTTFTCNIGLTYSTSTIDGTKQSNVAAVVSGTTPPTAAEATAFGSAIALAAVVTPTDYSVNLLGANRLKPLWQASGISADPGGYLDVTLTTTATNSGAPVINCVAYFIGD